MVEHQPSKLRVAGSNLVSRSKLYRESSLIFYTAEYDESRFGKYMCCGNSSVGRASASQAEGRGFESRFPLEKLG